MWSIFLKGLAMADKDQNKIGDSDGVRRKGIWKKLCRIRSRSRGSHVSPSEILDASAMADAFHAAVAAVVRAPPTEFMAVRRQWAAIRIQAAFRGLLARRALGALRGVVRLQAMVRGWLVRKQVAVTIERLQTLVWIGARKAAQRTEILYRDDSQSLCKDHCCSSSVTVRANRRGAHRSTSSCGSEFRFLASPSPSSPFSAPYSSPSRGNWALVSGRSFAISSSEWQIRSNPIKSKHQRTNRRSSGAGVSWRSTSQRGSSPKNQSTIS